MCWRIVWCALIGLALCTGAKGQAQVSVTGRVLPAWQLEVVSASGDTHYNVSAHAVSREEVTLVVQRRTSGAAPAASLPLLLALRTNAPAFSLLGSVRESGLEVRLLTGTGRASGTGQYVAPEAVGGLQVNPEALLGTDERVLARGTRISMGGNFRSPDNALVLPIRISLPQAEARQEEIRVNLRIGT